MQVQTRSEETGLRYFSKVVDAMEIARQDRTIWKISFTAANGEAIRLIRRFEASDEFVCEPMSLPKG